ncbi:hypothetical protein DH2020_002009 [Rehmannia glutinosa]|uniref:Uncharacterized protein n=1 Tax=Rehmannia glutinosa TaxID=99300 RepID=A0ABR0XSH6_REHGL
MSHQSATSAAIPNVDEADDKNQTSSGKKKTEKAKRSVGIRKLFAFADGYDYLLMFVGSIGACVHGASVPVFFIFFGKLINLIGTTHLFPKETSDRVAKYSLVFVYLSIVILFSSWTGRYDEGLALSSLKLIENEDNPGDTGMGDSGSCVSDCDEVPPTVAANFSISFRRGHT